MSRNAKITLFAETRVDAVAEWMDDDDRQQPAFPNWITISIDGRVATWTDDAGKHSVLGGDRVVIHLPDDDDDLEGDARQILKRLQDQFVDMLAEYDRRQAAIEIEEHQERLPLPLEEEA